MIGVRIVCNLAGANAELLRSKAEADADQRQNDRVRNVAASRHRQHQHRQRQNACQSKDYAPHGPTPNLRSLRK